jgi:hypothetical protein
VKDRPWIVPAVIGAVAGAAGIADFPVTMAVLGILFLAALVWRIHHGGLRDRLRWRAPDPPR